MPNCYTRNIATLPKRADFLAARRGKSRPATGVVVQIHHRRDTAPPRLGITATRKIGGAVVRNRARRRLRALGHSIIAQHGKTGCDYVLIARYNTHRLPWRMLKQSLTSTLASTGA